MAKVLKKDRFRNSPSPPKTEEAKQNFYDNNVKDGQQSRFEHYNTKKDEEK